MTSDNASLIQGMYDGFAKGDIPQVLEAMDPQVEWNEAENFPYADGNPYVGPAAVVEGVFKRLGEEWDTWSLAIEEFHDAGDTVVVLGRYSGAYKETGAQIDAQFAHVWWLRGGKVVRFQQYTDTAQIAAALGAP